jgi:hypothetical protein
MTGKGHPEIEYMQESMQEGLLHARVRPPRSRDTCKREGSRRQSTCKSEGPDARDRDSGGFLKSGYMKDAELLKPVFMQREPRS